MSGAAETLLFPEVAPLKSAVEGSYKNCAFRGDSTLLLFNEAKAGVQLGGVGCSLVAWCSPGMNRALSSVPVL